MLSNTDFPQYLGWLGIVVGGLWIINILSRIFFPVNFLSGLVLFSFLLWVFLTGLRLLNLAVRSYPPFI
ncbi:MAG: hypothetical protein QMD05_05255 [Candidatus Brocadiaceae bacterium]|nr:hypothetical protein [Candidatus Brocadiaceae bacterium]